MQNNYSHKNLQGCSFKEQNLAGADFSCADLRSADFTNAKLIGANFTGAKAGLQRRWLIAQLIISLGLATVAGILSGFTGVFSGFMLNPEIVQQSTNLPGMIVLLALIVLPLTVIIQGFTFYSFGTLAIAIAIAILLAVTLGLLNFQGAFGSAFAFAFAIAVAVAGAFTSAIASSVFGNITTISAIAVVTTFTFVVAVPFAIVLAHSVLIPVAVVVISIAIVLLLGSYIAWFSLQGDKKFILIRTISIAISTCGGTSFRDADLTDANFTEANLKSTDFRNANLTRTFWRNAKKIDRIRPGKTYLQNEQLQQLVITGKGENKNFARLDLRGLNLREADLKNASFIDADLYQANLQNADLSRAILVRTNFERADLRGAYLTGSCIQDWTLSKGTKLDGIVCDYVYLKWADGDKRDQMPHRGKFKKGGFVLFAKYILDTLDIYHNKDINPRLALTVLKKMSRDYDEPLDIVAVGKRGDKVFIKVKLSETVDSEEFKEDYFSRYDDGLKFISSSPKPLPSVDELVENRVTEIASNRNDEISSVNVTYIEYINTPKDLVIKGEVTVETMETGGDTIHLSGSTGIGVNKGTVNTEKLAGTINEASQQNLVEAAAEIQQLLKQLEETNPTETETVIAAKAADEIRNNPTLKARVIGALKSGGKEAFKEAVNNPLVNVLISIIEGWQEAE